jgi:uncharacterized protein involved in response to NO
MPESKPLVSGPKIPLFALGFRPFFLAAGASSCLSLLVWLAMLNGLLPINLQFAGSAWHAHEMLYGYAMAAIAGFLLTAVRNWTGQQTAAGAELAGLLLLWLMARALPWVALPSWLGAALAAAFPLMLAWSMRRPLWSGPNPVNRIFLALLAGMALAAFWSNLRAAGAAPEGLLDANALMLDLILLTLLIVSGRVLPFFTRAALAGADPRSHALTEILTFVAAGAWIAADLASPWPVLNAVTALALALMLTIRIGAWHDRRVWGIPILAVLYAGACWLILGLVLRALAELGLMAPNPALHALTAGAIGVFTIGMMVRVTLGHTGRTMVAPNVMTAAFIAVNAAALIRVGFPVLWPHAYGTWMLLSGLLWSGAFAAFLVVIGPMLLRPRIDGRPI